MKVSPYDLSPMVDRGMAKAALKDYTGAIADYTGDLSHGDYYEAYYQRAKVYITLGKIADACADLKKAGGSSHKDVDELIAKYCK